MQPLEPLFQVADLLAKGFIPSEAHAAIRLDAITALKKPTGVIRGIVVGDFVGRLVARPIAQQVSEDVEQATKPFQFALRTRAGCECVGHVLDTLAEMDENAALLSVDGAGAFDLISRKSTTEGFFRRAEWGQVASICVPPQRFSVHFLWEVERGQSTSSLKGGERTRRPVDAPPLQPRATSRLVCSGGEVASGEQRETLDDSDGSDGEKTN